jgi:hypothetical protein
MYLFELILGLMMVVAFAIMLWPEKPWPQDINRDYNHHIDDQQGV